MMLVWRPKAIAPLAVRTMTFECVACGTPLASVAVAANVPEGATSQVAEKQIA